MASESQDSNTKDWFDAVYEAVLLVPSGKVATYGQIAESVTTYSVSARQVGAALRYAPDSIPWQRVVGARGRLPIAKRSPELKVLQRRLLLQEGVAFLTNDPDQIDMSTAQLTAAVRQAHLPGCSDPK